MFCFRFRLMEKLEVRGYEIAFSRVCAGSERSCRAFTLRQNRDLNFAGVRDGITGLRPIIRAQPFRGARADTDTTEFTQPNTLGTLSVARGSATQRPSTTNRYSYRPGGRNMTRTHRPPAVRTIRMFDTSQLLNDPAMVTSRAAPLLHSNQTGCGCTALAGVTRPACAGQARVFPFIRSLRITFFR